MAQTRSVGRWLRTRRSARPICRRCSLRYSRWTGQLREGLTPALPNMRSRRRPTADLRGSIDAFEQRRNRMTRRGSRVQIGGDRTFIYQFLQRLSLCHCRISSQSRCVTNPGPKPSRIIRRLQSHSPRARPAAREPRWRSACGAADGPGAAVRAQATNVTGEHDLPISFIHRASNIRLRLAAHCTGACWCARTSSSGPLSDSGRNRPCAP